jgi:hypothetical protein
MIMKTQHHEAVKIKAMAREENAGDCSLQDLADNLYLWTNLFNTEFFKDQPVAVPVISFERTRMTSVDLYVPGRNLMGSLESINIGQAQLDGPLWGILVALLHDLCHLWQKLYGNPSNSWFHNKEFLQKMLSFGVLVDSKGCHLGVGDPFVSLLEKQGIQFDEDRNSEGIIGIPIRPKTKGNSKLKKWTCGCTNIRVAVPNLRALCLKCNREFERAV